MNAVLKKQPRNSRKAVRKSPSQAKIHTPSENPLPRTVTTEITWSIFATEVFAECNGDKAAAIQRMTGMLTPGSALFERLVTPLIHQAVEGAIRFVHIRSNRSAWKGTATSSGDGLEALAESLLASFRLPGGILLREATASDLKDAANFYRSQANTMAHKARWFDAIAARIGRKKVGDVLDEAAVRELQDSTK